MNKKVTLSLLSATVFASMAASAFAAPTQGVYMGGSVDKFYKLDDLFQLSAEAKKEFVSRLNAANPDGDFKNLVFVDFDGKGAKFSEILAQGTLAKAKRDLTKADFEGSYVTVNTDGTDGVSYDPRNDAVDGAPGELKVESVSAINLKQLEVKFNKEVDKTTAEDETLYFENGSALSSSVATAELQDDNKTVILTFATKKAQNATFTYKVDGVEDADGNAIESGDFTAKFADTTLPTVSKAEYKGGKVVITFSEPLATAPSVVRVNGNPVTFGFVSGSTTQVETQALTLAANSTVTLYVAGAKDEAGLEMNLYNGSFNTPAADTVKPAITSVTQVSQNTVRFVVSEELGTSASDLEDGDVKVLKGSTVYADGVSGTSVTVTKNTTVDPSGKTYDVAFDLGGAGAPDYGIYASSTAASQAVTLLLDADVIKDAAGNGNVAYSQGFTFNRDTQGPAFVSAKASANKEVIEVTFNEDIKAAASDIDESKIIVTDASGVRYPAINATTVGKSGAPKVLEIDFVASGTMANGTYTVQIGAGAVKDALGNLNTAASTTVTVGDPADTTKPTVTLDTETTIDTLQSSANKFVVDFGEEVGSSALNLSNYKLDGAALPTGTVIYFNSTAKDSVTIELPAESINFGVNPTGADAVLTVSNVADKAGNVAVTTNLTAKVADNTGAVVQSVQVYGNDILLTFNENIDTTSTAAIDTVSELAADFEIKVGSDLLNLGTLGTGGTGGSAASVAAALVPGNAKQVKITITPQVNGTGYTGQVASNWDPTKVITVKTLGATLLDENKYGVKAGVSVHN
ncbi:hypothetical protein [Brevibacillus sp. SAFN-007a]|uniref:hypothetical protein n=1 Tax=Brevibacillus sp. SAFN-007a TaxID=3436862 RepID=UPI003F7DAA84